MSTVCIVYVLMPVNSSVLKVYLLLVSMFMDFCLVSGMLMIVAFFFVLLSMHVRVLVRMPMGMRMLVSMFSTHNKSSYL